MRQVFLPAMCVVIAAACGAAPLPASGVSARIDFSRPDWKAAAGILRREQWGFDNLRVVDAPPGLPVAGSKCLRASFPKNSASPTVARQNQAPLGGGQFRATLGLKPADSLHLFYRLRFDPKFDFVKGGKLPGLCGGLVNSGRRIPDGTDGFSTRMMWRRGGAGEVYAYLPTSTEHGTSLGRGNWRFEPGRWHTVEQHVQLNTPGQDNGSVTAWFDGREVLRAERLRFRTVKDLQIDGLFFSTFFGGSDRSWATPADTFIDFADFQISDKAIGAAIAEAKKP